MEETHAPLATEAVPLAGSKFSPKAAKEYPEKLFKARQHELRKRMQHEQSVDFLFLVDATGSMIPWIKKVRAQFKETEASLAREFPGMQLRAGVVAYRDYDDAVNVETLDFTADNTVFVQFLDKLRPKGGADECEDVFSGLEAAAKLSWKSNVRLVFHTADAPCHGRDYHDGCNDTYPDGDKHGRKAGELLQSLKKDAGVQLYFFSHLKETTRKMIATFQDLLGSEKFWIEHDKAVTPEHLVKMLRLSIQRSIQRSIRASEQEMVRSVSTVSSVSMRTVSRASTWSDVRWKAAPRVALSVRRVEADDLAVDAMLYQLGCVSTLPWTESSAAVLRVEKDPFNDHGSERWPFFARLEQQRGWAAMLCGRSLLKQVIPDQLVLKELKHEDDMHGSQARLLAQQQAVAAILAREFTADCNLLSPGMKCSLKFVPVYLAAVMNQGGKVCTVEPWISGAFKKATNNGGYCARADEFCETLQAFSHYTYYRTKGEMMVTDLQGAWCTNASSGKQEFTLTDPAIHSTKHFTHASTNLQDAGICAFFKAHTCNELCKALHLDGSSPAASASIL